MVVGPIAKFGRFSKKLGQIACFVFWDREGMLFAGIFFFAKPLIPEYSKRLVFSESTFYR